MKSKILMPYAPILIESTRALGYSFETALADIIDNSISKYANSVKVFFSSMAPQYVVVVDNGKGMSKEELMSAMRYGSQSALAIRHKDDLGRFGLGLKTASLSQCRKLTVLTKKDDTYHAACWDLDNIIAKEDWALIVYDSKEIRNLRFYDILKTYKSGTVVIWENFDKLSESSSNSLAVFDEKIEFARKHIALVFHRFMELGVKKHKLSIEFNNDMVEPIDPFLRDNNGTQPLTEQTFKINGESVKVKPYILPHANKVSKKDRLKLGDLCDLRSNQGFYVYRNKRLIIWGTWFRLKKLEELNKLARIRVDIPNTLDSIWDIDIKKSRASLPDIIKQNLVILVEKAVGRSEEVYRYRGRKNKNDKLEHVWESYDNRGTFEYRINKMLPIYKIIEEKLDATGKKYLSSLITMLEESFPFEDVYYRLAKNKNSITEVETDFNKIYDIAVELMYAYEEVNGNKKGFLDKMEHIDYLYKYPKVIKKLREDYYDE